MTIQDTERAVTAPPRASTPATAAGLEGCTSGAGSVARTATAVAADCCERVLGERMVLIDGPESVQTPEGFLLPAGIFDSLATAQMLVDAGADVIVEASTGLTSIGMADVLRRRLGVPVIDPVVAAGAVLVSAVAARELQAV